MQSSATSANTTDDTGDGDVGISIMTGRFYGAYPEVGVLSVLLFVGWSVDVGAGRPAIRAGCGPVMERGSVSSHTDHQTTQMPRVRVSYQSRRP